MGDGGLDSPLTPAKDFTLILGKPSRRAAQILLFLP